MHHLVRRTRVVTVWCPDWPVVAGSDAGRDGAPVAVVAANRVVACSAAARAEGVQRGLRRRQAEARCPGLVVVAPDPAREARAFEPVVAAVETFTPRIEIVRPGVCVFAARGPSRYFGGDEALAAQVVARVDEVVADLAAPGCRVGVADGHFASGRAARSAAPERPVVLVPPGESAAFLAPFPVSVLGPELGGADPSELPDLLVRLGIRTVGEFAALPAKAVLARFGPDALGAHRLARGLDERPLAARTPPADLTVTAELDPPVEQLDTVAFVARSLAARLHGALAARGLAVGLVRVEAQTEHGEPLSRTWRVDGGAAALAERVRWQLDGWLTAGTERPTGPLTLLRLVPEEIRPDGGRQEGFWGGDRAASERAARACERVQGRLGPDSVATAVIGGGRDPAEQVRLVPWGDPRQLPTEPATRTRLRHPAAAAPPWPGRLPPPAPATVLPAPLPAEVVDATGAPVGVSGRGLPTGPPARIAVGGRPPSAVVAWAGPWPVDERWWDPPAHRRRARWQMVTEDGTAHLLVLEGGSWFVEATYD